MGIPKYIPTVYGAVSSSLSALRCVFLLETSDQVFEA